MADPWTITVDGAVVAESMGVYCLVNSAVYDWFVAFCEGLRAVEPTLPLVVIPFADDMDRIAGLAARYTFTIWSDPCLAELDRIGLEMRPEHPEWAHLYRKFATFVGPLERFLFLDADTIPMHSLRPLLDALSGAACDLLCFDSHMEQVARPGPFRDALEQRGSLGFNTGAFISRRGALTLQDVMMAAGELTPTDVATFALTGEQPFLNYVAATRLRVRAAPDALSWCTWHTWAGKRGYGTAHGAYRCLNRASASYRRIVPFVHWAGYRPDRRMPYPWLYLRSRLRGAESVSELAGSLYRFLATKG